MEFKKEYDLIVIGAGAAGIMAAITAAKDAKSVLLLEKLPQIGSKLKATGGGKCNLSNTLSNDDFISKFGKEGHFMQEALNAFDNNAMQDFFASIGVETHAPDGFRIFPISHNSQTIITALETEMQKLKITVLCSQRVKNIKQNGNIKEVNTQDKSFFPQNIIIATGGLGYPTLGAEGDGFEIAKALGHKITPLYPAMLPLKTKERWVQNCRSQTVAKAVLKVNIKKHQKLKAVGDLIFTKDGIRGPVVLDFARELTPLIELYGEVPLLVNFIKGRNEDEILKHLKNEASKNRSITSVEIISTLMPETLSNEICNLANIAPDSIFNKIEGSAKDTLIKLLAWTPLHIVGHDGFKNAMITRGGVDLKEVDPKTMQSKIAKGVYFCGEVLNLDGPCGGYNLQWSFASGYLAGKLKS
ncbi:MAG: hypothetical protein QG559_1127 [Campylobacterota bacterium]|nr:hypothetical protein [Campylobacterota bacterium]